MLGAVLLREPPLADQPIRYVAVTEMHQKTPSQLKPELTSLVHHVHLNATGWWKGIVERMVQVVLFQKPEGMAEREIAPAIESALGAGFEAEAVSSAIRVLIGRGALVSLTDETLRLSEPTRAQLSQELSDAVASSQRVSQRFAECLTHAGLRLPPDETWTRFVETWLYPTICDIGARTYQLIGGSLEEWESKRDLADFLDGFSKEDAPALRKAVEAFFDPKDEDVRAHVFRLLDSYYTLEASGLGGTSLDVLGAHIGQSAGFTLLLDTNVILSLIGLHGEQEREAALSLVALVKQIAHRVRAKVCVTAPTLKETQAALARKQEQVQDIRMTPSMAAAVLRSGVDSTLAALARASLSAGTALDGEAYLKPYSGALLSFLQGFGVALHNDRLASDIALEDPVRADIEKQREYELRVYGDKAKSKGKIQHDVALWHFVKRKRPLHTEGIANAGYWFVTEDSRVIAFDKARQREGGEQIPICIHPLVLTQLLQLWSGRTPELEAALVGGIRMSMFVPSFGTSSEEATIRILNALSRFENVGDLTEETIVQLLFNDALRSRLLATEESSEQSLLVREAVVEENQRLHAALTTLSAEQQSAKVALEASVRREKATAEHAARLKRLHSDAATELDSKVKTLGEVASEKEGILSELQKERGRSSNLETELAAERRQSRTSREYWRFIWLWLAVPAFLATAGIFLLWRTFPRNDVTPARILVELAALSAAVLLVIELATSAGTPSPEVQESRLYRIIRRLRKSGRFITSALVITALTQIGSDSGRDSTPKVTPEATTPSPFEADSAVGTGKTP